MKNSEFNKIILPIENNLFDELFNSGDFENIAEGRLGANLVDLGNKGVPIVRTTTNYDMPSHSFSAVHYMIISLINDTLKTTILNGIPLMQFDNALIEVYNNNYYKMNYHSDQCLDLESDSFIGIFSCYENPYELLAQNIRKLIIKDKISNNEYSISLTHNSVILFSLETNAKFVHKIVLETVSNAKQPSSDNRWLGITFRKSKTFIKFKDNIPYLSNGELFSLANDEQKSEFYKFRGQENKNLDFMYPEITYTLSVGDTLMPKSNL